MVALISLPEAKAQCRVDHDDDDAQIQSFIETASDRVVRYCKQELDAWDIETVPAQQKTAILLIVQKLYDREEGPLFDEAVVNVLYGERDPTLA